MNRVRIMVGDVFGRLAELPDESVHCVVTSPPYWGLRAYGGEEKMIGLEPTFEEHLDVLVRVFREVRRVLRSDGTLWLNYGDAYSGGGRGPAGGPMQNTNLGSLDGSLRSFSSCSVTGLAAKQLLMMPTRIALALQADGWWVRAEIIWFKQNSMPESVTDRPTSAHEKIFLLRAVSYGEPWGPWQRPPMARNVPATYVLCVPHEPGERPKKVRDNFCYRAFSGRGGGSKPTGGGGPDSLAGPSVLSGMPYPRGRCDVKNPYPEKSEK